MLTRVCVLCRFAFVAVSYIVARRLFFVVDYCHALPRVAQNVGLPGVRGDALQVFLGRVRETEVST